MYPLLVATIALAQPPVVYSTPPIVVVEGSSTVVIPTKMTPKKSYADIYNSLKSSGATHHKPIYVAIGMEADGYVTAVNPPIGVAKGLYKAWFDGYERMTPISTESPVKKVVTGVAELVLPPYPTFQYLGGLNLRDCNTGR